MIKRITVRADAGHFWGYGHIQRTSTVMNRIVDKTDVQVRYLMDTAADASLLKKFGYEVHFYTDCNIETILNAVNPDEGPLIIDTYSVKNNDLLKLCQKDYCVAVFEDGRRLNNYPVDLVIDYSPNAKNLNYQGNSKTRFCLGPKFYPLRKEFVDKRYQRLQKRKVKKITITFGGSDPDRQTERILKILSEHQHNWEITAVIGPGYSRKIENLNCKNSVRILRNVTDMAEVFHNSDLVISSSGSTALELVYLGIPSILIILSQDQEPIAHELEKAEAALCLGWFNGIDDQLIWRSINEVASDSNFLNQMNINGPKIVDGKGAERISDAILSSWTRYLDLHG